MDVKDFILQISPIQLHCKVIYRSTYFSPSGLFTLFLMKYSSVFTLLCLSIVGKCYTRLWNLLNTSEYVSFSFFIIIFFLASYGVFCLWNKIRPIKSNLWFMNSLVCISFYPFSLVCAYVCTLNSVLLHAWLNVGCLSCWDAKQQKRGRLSANVSRVETGGKRSIMESATFPQMLLVFISISVKEKTLSACKLAACLGLTWHNLCRHQESNTKPWRKQSNWAAQLESSFAWLHVPVYSFFSNKESFFQSHTKANKMTLPL